MILICHYSEVMALVVSIFSFGVDVTCIGSDLLSRMTHFPANFVRKCFIDPDLNLKIILPEVPYIVKNHTLGTTLLIPQVTLFKTKSQVQTANYTEVPPTRPNNT